MFTCALSNKIFKRLLQEENSWWAPFPSPDPQPRHMDTYRTTAAQKLSIQVYKSVSHPHILLHIHSLKDTPSRSSKQPHKYGSVQAAPTWVSTIPKVTSNPGREKEYHAYAGADIWSGCRPSHYQTYLSL